MSLSTPNLDDRGFQDIVDEAKRRIPRHCPEWTDHNVSDPGIALIELFAWMTEMTIYRLNQVPDQLYVKFLELMGIRLFPPAAATTHLLFRLSGPQPQPVGIPAATEVATRRRGSEEPVVFMTDREAVANPARLVACHTITAHGQHEDKWDDLQAPQQRVDCFPTTTAGDAIYFGLEQPLSNSLLAIEVSGVVAWVGVEPLHPPWSWEVWAGGGWIVATVLSETTLAFQQDGTIELLLPEGHQQRELGRTNAHWLRCRLTESQPAGPEGEPRSPRINDVRVSTIGVAVAAHHARPRPPERLGTSTGAPAQTFAVRQSPVLARSPEETVTVDGEPWQEVTDDFAASGPGDRHFTWDSTTGEVTFGPAVHHADGSTTQHGAVPPHGARVAVTGYRTGGGSRGNVGAHTLRVLRSPLPFVDSVDNPESARGGVDGETVDNARWRGPLTLLTGQRAITAADFERLAREASPIVARVRCLPPTSTSRPELSDKDLPQWVKDLPDYDQLDESGPATQGQSVQAAPIRVLLASHSQSPPDRLGLDELIPDESVLSTVRDYLDERRTLTSSIELGNLWFQGVKVRASLQVSPTAAQEAVQQRARAALYDYINPLVGGPEGTGWPFDRPLTVGEVHGLLAGVDGVEYAESVELVRVIHMGRDELEEQPRQRINLAPNALFASYHHEVSVT